MTDKNMHRNTLAAIVCSVAALAFTPAHAGEEVVLLEAGDWTASIRVTDEGNLYCRAHTTSSDGQLAINMAPWGTILALGLPGIDAKPGTYDLAVEVDDIEWRFEDVSLVSSDNGPVIIHRFEDGSTSGRFLAQLAMGAELTMPMTNVADFRFSLSGSRQVIYTAIYDCLQLLVE